MTAGPKLLGGGGYKAMMHTSNFEKSSLVGQNIATGMEKDKTKLFAKI